MWKLLLKLASFSFPRFRRPHVFLFLFLRSHILFHSWIHYLVRAFNTCWPFHSFACHVLLRHYVRYFFLRLRLCFFVQPYRDKLQNLLLFNPLQSVDLLSYLFCFLPISNIGVVDDGFHLLFGFF